jgi:hypothetical protein
VDAAQLRLADVAVTVATAGVPGAVGGVVSELPPSVWIIAV